MTERDCNCRETVGHHRLFHGIIKFITPSHQLSLWRKYGCHICKPRRNTVYSISLKSRNTDPRIYMNYLFSESNVYKNCNFTTFLKQIILRKTFLNFENKFWNLSLNYYWKNVYKKTAVNMFKVLWDFYNILYTKLPLTTIHTVIATVISFGIKRNSVFRGTLCCTMDGGRVKGSSKWWPV